MLEFPTDDWVAVVGNFGNPFALDALTGDEGVCHELAFGIGNTAGFVLGPLPAPEPAGHEEAPGWLDDDDVEEGFVTGDVVGACVGSCEGAAD